MKSRGGRVRMFGALLTCLMMMTPVPGASAARPSEDPSCARHDLELELVAGEGTAYHVAGWVCALAPHPGQTVIIASPPGLSTHAYWDWPVKKGVYSFVRDFTRAGYAVFNYDRIGTGASDRPAAALVNLETEAYQLHQIVGQLRAGAIGGVRFGKVVLAGNSLSSLISIFEAERYQDVDGLINTGAFVGPTPKGLAELFASFYPAQLDPKFAGDPDIPPGYATTVPGSRDRYFHLPAAEASTVQLDEELKDTATVGEATTFGIWIPFTRLVDAPVLSVMGDHDFLFCLDVCEPGGVEETKEHASWPDSACLEVEIVPDAGHSLQLHPRAAADFAALAEEWLTRRVGPDTTVPPTQPCIG